MFIGDCFLLLFLFYFSSFTMKNRDYTLMQGQGLLGRIRESLNCQTTHHYKNLATDILNSSGARELLMYFNPL